MLLQKYACIWTYYFNKYNVYTMKIFVVIINWYVISLPAFTFYFVTEFPAIYLFLIHRNGLIVSVQISFCKNFVFLLFLRFSSLYFLIVNRNKNTYFQVLYFSTSFIVYFTLKYVSKCQLRHDITLLLQPFH